MMIKQVINWGSVFIRGKRLVSMKMVAMGLFVSLLLAGCHAPKQFAYKTKMSELGVARSGTQFDNVSIAVMPMTDNRKDKSSTEGWSWFAFLPLVPCMPYHNYDMEHYSTDIGELKFDKLVELREAIIEHIRYDGLADVSSVRINGAPYRQYTLLDCSIVNARVQK